MNTKSQNNFYKVIEVVYITNTETFFQKYRLRNRGEKEYDYYCLLDEKIYFIIFRR